MAKTLAEIVAQGLGDDLVRQTVGLVQRQLQRQSGSGEYDAPNLWAEVCIYAREGAPGYEPYSLAWGAIRDCVLVATQDWPDYKKSAIWYLTDSGFESYLNQLESEVPADAGANFCEEDVVGHLTNEVLQHAVNFNSRFLDHYLG